MPYPILVTIAFFLWGSLCNGWKVAWTLFLTVPIYYSVVDTIRLRRLSSFCYPLFATFAYCFIGMQWHIWHPTWILFITIPVYYAITEPIAIYNRKKHR